MKTGSLIALEGIDACGKMTHSKRLAKALGAKLFSFPDYDGPGGNAVKQLLTGGWRICTSGTVEDPPDRAQALAIQSFHAVSRYEHAGEIASILARGQHVVCDRYYASGLVYGEADGLPLGWLWKIHARLPQPNCSLLIDISPEESVRRRSERRDEYEKRAGFMEKVRAGYLRLFAECLVAGPGRWNVVDGMGTEDEVAARIMRCARRVCASSETL